MTSTTESIIACQKQLAEEISRLLRNIRKDGPDRKTEEYRQKKVTDLKKFWNEFSSLHAQLEQSISKEHPYFTEGLYEKTYEIYKAAIELISNYHASQKEKPKEAPLTTPSKFSLITTETSGVSTTPFASTTTSAITNFPLIATTATILPTVTSTAIFTNNTQPTTSSPWIHAQQTTFPIQYQEANGLNNVPKLPPIKVPKFNGDYKEWKSFIDIFTNVIHNNPYISNVEKMQYLLYYLEGDARRVIGHLQLNNNNYRTALQLIQARYNNNRKIITTYVNTIIDAPKTEHRSQQDMIMLYDLIRECLEALKNLNCNTDEWGPMIVCISMRKLDTESLRLFEESLANPREMPSVEDLLKFLERRHQVLDCIKSSKQQKPEIYIKNSKRSFHTTLKRSCILCSKNHNIYQCGEFKQMSVDDRHVFVKQKKLCPNCLVHNKTERCKSTKSCISCKKKHHSLLHRSYEKGTSSSDMPLNIEKSNVAAHLTTNACLEARNQEDLGQDAITFHMSNTKLPHVLLPTAMVRIKNTFGQIESLRALIDPCSQVSLITEEAVQILKLQKQRIKATILGVGEAESAKASNKVNISLQLRHKKESYLTVEALVLSKLNSYLPEAHVNGIDINKYGNIVLADPNFDKPGPIDLLLGADVYADIIIEGIRKEQPAAQNTKLGWILFGSTPSTFKETTKISSFLSLAELDQKLETFWEIQENGSSNQVDETCETHFETTHKRDEEGRYIVQLPFKPTMGQLGHSGSKAIARLLQMEKKLRKSPSDMADYNKFLSEYVELGHMTLAKPFKGDETKVYYMPHHAVFKRESTTTKLRVVFDASSKTDSGLSLNDLLHSGPKLQQDLAQIFLRWRRYRYVYTADIEKMFRQIKIAEEDKNYQRILWRKEPNGPIQEYLLNTITYGTAPATYLAVRTLHQLAKDEGSQFPLGRRVLTNDFYVDDMLTGADTIEEARTLKNQIITLLHKGRFNLRKWTSNNKELLKDIPEDIREEGILEIKEHDTIKALGIHWNPNKDEFQFKLRLEKLDSRLTKRHLLSRISTIFDPLGWLAPITFTAKVIMQSLWKTGTDWDQQVPSEITGAWEKLERELTELETIRIPRWINHRKEYEIQIHGFCDASEKGYAAVIYSRTVDSFGKIHTTLLTSKTKVAPLKQKITLPRLELCGALLLTQLLKTTIATLELKTSAIFAWCDSEITLAWIAKSPNSWNTFVANRVSEIQSLMPNNMWRHISSQENPADVASRGTSPTRLVSHKLWWKGPSWLSQPPKAWPTNKLNVITNEEAKTKAVTLNTTTTELASDVLNCSNYTRQVRIVAYCRRFIQNCKLPRALRKMDYLTSDEIQGSKDCIIKIVQQEAFHDERETLKKRKPLKKSSKILSLHPFLDSKGILRVGGRLQNSNLSTEAKHQILLPQKHHITNLIIEHAHHQTLHGGTQLTLNHIRTQFWIINAKSIVQSRNRRCIRCLRHRQDGAQQLMGNLPSVRITPSPPFSHCGVDYAGPFLTKMSKGRGTKTIKGYIALFICMVTKAIHLELVSDLTTDAFLAAYKRFVARRGNCKQLFSDNATNFVGARNKMDKDLQNAINNSTKRAAEIIANDGTEWKFIPPASPHIGGLWEAGVKSVKGHLKRVLGETLLTYEEFTTVLHQVEACLNSRPIGQQSCDPTDFEALTPGHFLIGRPLIAPPEPDISNKEVHQRWKLVTKLQQDIWKRWSEEYLSLLQQRSKWTTMKRNPAVGELALVKEDNLPPQKWSLGRIFELHPGEDGIVRIVSIKDKHGIKKRPLNKLCQLPINISSTEEDCTQPVKTMITTVKSIKPRICIDTKTRSTIQHAPKLWSKPEHFDRLKGQTTNKRSNAYFDPPHTKRLRIAPCTWASKLLHSTLVILYWLTIVFAQDYEILKPRSGLYIENLGHAQIKRGNLRLQISFPLSDIFEDQKMINKTWNQVQEMCKQTKELTDITHCNVLFKHMSLKRNNLLTATDEIIQLAQHKDRRRRGLLGKLLTSVFGVNDEIYTDIETLQHNQQAVLQATNQQVLLINTKINQSNSIIWNKLKQFDSRLSQVITSINEMKTWYSQADHNRISTEVISTSVKDYYN